MAGDDGRGKESKVVRVDHRQDCSSYSPSLPGVARKIFNQLCALQSTDDLLQGGRRDPANQ